MFKNLSKLTLFLIFSISLLRFIPLSAEEPYLYCQRKWKELDLEGLKVQIFKLRAEEFPPGDEYTLFIRNCDGSETEVFGYKANKKGHLIVQMSQELKKGAPFAVTPLRQGERISYCMKKKCQQEGAEAFQEYIASLVPFPIQVTRGDALLAIELADAEGKAFICRGEGFSLDETLTFTCRSGNREQSLPVTLSASGTFEYRILPEIPGQFSGKAEVILEQKGRTLSLPLVWGRAAQAFVGAVCLQVH